jgi:hypothetical protein
MTPLSGNGSLDVMLSLCGVRKRLQSDMGSCRRPFFRFPDSPSPTNLSLSSSTLQTGSAGLCLLMIFIQWVALCW